MKMRFRLGLSALALVSMVALTACPIPIPTPAQIIQQLKDSLLNTDVADDAIDCSILIGMPTLPTLQHPASNTGMYKVNDERYPWEIWSAVCAGRVAIFKIETGGGNGHPTGPWMEAVLWPFSNMNWWGTWTTWQTAFQHPNINMTLWRNAYIVARPLGY